MKAWQWSSRSHLANPHAPDAAVYDGRAMAAWDAFGASIEGSDTQLTHALFVLALMHQHATCVAVGASSIARIYCRMIDETIAGDVRHLWRAVLTYRRPVAA